MNAADSNNVDLERSLAEFQRDLASLRLERDVSFKAMETRLKALDLHPVEATGSDTSFNDLLRTSLRRPPRRALLRGFLLGLAATPLELAAWEQRRLDLERLQRSRRTVVGPEIDVDRPSAENPTPQAANELVAYTPVAVDEPREAANASVQPCPGPPATETDRQLNDVQA
jgi:hypothetical protein